MRPAVVVLSAIGAIEITTIGDIKTTLEGFAIEETLTRFQNVIAGEFPASVFESLHAAWTKPSVYRQSSLDAKSTASYTSLTGQVLSISVNFFHPECSAGK
jgi:hypothetical protein